MDGMVEQWNDGTRRSQNKRLDSSLNLPFFH